MRLYQLTSLQYPDTLISIFDDLPGQLSTPIKQGHLKDLDLKDLSSQEVTLVSGASDQACGIRIWIKK